MNRFEVYTPDFSKRYEIAQPISISITSRYNGIGKISIIMTADDYNIKTIQNGSLVLDKGTGETYIIVMYKIDTVNNRVTFNGYTSNSILNNRVVAQNNKIKSIADLYKMITDNLRGLDYINISDNLATEKIDSELFGGQLLDKIMLVLKRYNLGNRMIWNDNTKKLTFEIYKGQDLTQGLHSIIFSYERGTAQNLVLSDDVSMFKSTMYISGQKTDDSRVIEVVGNDVMGKNRIEKWITEVPLQRLEQSEIDFKQSLKETAETQKAKYTERKNFEADIDPSEFNKFYSLGDIVTCISTKFDVQFNKRITGIQYFLDSDGEKTSLLLGEPEINILEEMMLNA